MINGVSSIDIPQSAPRKRGAPAWLLARIKEEQELRFWPHPFRSISEFLEAFSLPQKMRKEWRLTHYTLGSINAIPASRGRIAATNGILCLIVREDGTLFEGHVQWFEAEDKLEADFIPKGQKVRKPSVLDAYI